MASETVQLLSHGELKQLCAKDPVKQPTCRWSCTPILWF